MSAACSPGSTPRLRSPAAELLLRRAAADDGHVYIWNREARLLRWLRGDGQIVNCLSPNPAIPLVLATSGVHLLRGCMLAAWHVMCDGARAPRLMRQECLCMGLALPHAATICTDCIRCLHWRIASEWLLTPVASHVTESDEQHPLPKFAVVDLASVPVVCAPHVTQKSAVQLHEYGAAIDILHGSGLDHDVKIWAPELGRPRWPGVMAEKASLSAAISALHVGLGYELVPLAEVSASCHSTPQG